MVASMDKTVGLNEVFDGLLVKYGIDRFHGRFQEKIRAETLIRSFADKNAAKEWILVAENRTDKIYFCRAAGQINVRQTILYEELSKECLTSLAESQECLIAVISFYDRHEVINQLYNHHIKHISVYDFLFCNGCCSAGNFYDVFGEIYSGLPFRVQGKKLDYAYLDINAIFFCDRRGYECCQEPKEREYYLARMIFDCAFARDIERMFRYIREYVENRYSQWEQYQLFYSEVEKLLQEIARQVGLRQQKDVVVFWLDALEHGEDRDMPWLASIAERSLEFERAYTVTPYTHSTARALLAEKYIVDDHAFQMRIDDSCALVRDLQEKGYRVLFYTKLHEVDDGLKGGMPQNECTPLSQICWNFLHDLLKTEGPVFAILHELFQTHFPYVSMGLTGTEYYCTPTPKDSREEQRIYRTQAPESRKCTDQVLCFYHKLLGRRMIQIFMSDHGHTYLDRFHTVFRVLQENVRPQKFQGIFSYISFGTLIRKLIAGDTEYSGIFSPYAKVQDTDYYNRNHIEYVIRQRPQWSLDLFGYEGIITDKICYLRYNDGREEYYSAAPGGAVEEQWVRQARELCPAYPDGIIEAEKFQYARNVYATQARYLARNRQFEEEKQRAILDIFEKLPDSVTVALRGGGIHTYRLWMLLPWALKRKISLIIDQNPDCIASRLGIPVVTPAQIRKQQVDYVVVSSFEFEEHWTQELREQLPDATVIGLYRELLNRGVSCKLEFYYKEFVEDDLVWRDGPVSH